MANNYLQSGHSMTLTPTVAVSAGEGCMFGNGLFGIALNDVAAGKKGAFGTVGVWQLPKQTGVAIADGSSVIYDFTNKRVATSGIGPRIGVAEAALSSAPYVSVRLDHSPNGVTYEQNLVTGGIVKTIWVGTQAEYDAITTKDANTEYNIVAA